MKDTRPAKEELKAFLAQHCEVKSMPSGGAGGKHTTFLFHTKDCILFMAEAYVHGMRNAIGQTEEVMAAAKKKADYSEVIMVYNWSAPEPGMDVVQIPETLVNKLSKEQAAVFLRNLRRILKDMQEGAARREGLCKLFGDHVTITTTYALDGERLFFIIGKPSAADPRSYAERYAEHAATNVLFDLSKALNARLQAFLPEYAQGKYFVEERSSFHKKVRYGEQAQTELLLTDEGAETFLKTTADSPQMETEISRLFRQAMLDPVGLALKYYLGKHPLIKLPSKDDGK